MGLAQLSDADRARLDAAADLKGGLVAFALTPPFEKHLRAQLRQADDLEAQTLDQHVRAIESLLFEHRYDDGSTVLDRFVRQQRDIDPEQAELLSAWNDSVYGIFEILEVNEDQLLLLNLLDELSYPSYASMGAASISSLHRGDFVVTRVVPVGEHWLLSGAQRPLPASARSRVAKLALDLSLKRPSLVLRNPDKRRQAERSARLLHESFVDCFGTDRVVVRGPELAPTYQRFIDHHTARRRADGADTPRVPPANVTNDPAFAESFADADTVGIVHREDSGIWFFVGYDLVAGAFADPSTLDRTAVRERVRSYLEDDTIPQWVFDDLHQRHPDHVDAVWAVVLGRPGFRWSADGAALLRNHRPDGTPAPYVSAVPTPSIALEHLAAR